MKGQGLLLAIVTAVVVAAVVTGFFLAGTPREAREYALDDKRVENLRDFSNALFYAWNKRQEPPPFSMDEYMEANPIAAGLVDPVTRRPYGYRNLGNGKFELCATFDKAVPGDESKWGAEWAHPAGPYCFEFDVKTNKGPEGVGR